jgi:DNA-binding transcriptional MerR regulator
MVQSGGSKTLRSGALAKSAGVSPDTIRHYERIGVLPRASRTQSGYRVYPASALERVLVVQRALRIGFTLAELAEVLKARDAGGAPCRRVYQLAHDKLKAIEADIEALKRTKRYVKKVLSDWEQRIQRAGTGEKSHLLYSLSDAVKNAGTPVDRFRRKNRQ